MKEVIIDAKDRALGRVATEAAQNLMGKTSADYSPSELSKTRVKITNLSRAKISEERIGRIAYKKYSGYPGSLKHIPVKNFWEKNPKVTFKRIVGGMLPKNKLKREILKNLIIED